jgi:hypothetical protein
MKSGGGIPYRADQSLKIREIRTAEFIGRMAVRMMAVRMPPSQIALRATLVRAMAFPHH